MSNIGLVQLRDLATAVLTASKTSPENAAMVAAALVKADADGIPSHGVSRLPAYADQARAGKVDGLVKAVVKRTAAATISVDAGSGFAVPAIRAGISAALDIVPETGMVGLAGQAGQAGQVGVDGLAGLASLVGQAGLAGQAMPASR